MLLGTTVVQPHFTGSRLASLDSVWGEYYSLGYVHASPVAFRYIIQLDIIDISHCNMRQGQLFRRLLRLLGSARIWCGSRLDNTTAGIG